MSLNSKKSWHPGRAINKAKVVKFEEDENDKLKKEELRLQELEAEREMVRLKEQAKEDTARSDKVEDRLAWMYETKQESLLSSKEYISDKSNEEAANLKNKMAPSIYGTQPKNSGSIDRKLSARKRAADPLNEMLKRTKSNVAVNKKSKGSKLVSRNSVKKS